MAVILVVYHSRSDPTETAVAPAIDHRSLAATVRLGRGPTLPCRWLGLVLALNFWANWGGPVTGEEPARVKGERRLENFNYRGVTLDGGRMRMQLDEVQDEYLRIPNDDLLKGFRRRAGLPAPGKDLGGWYSADVFHIFGQIISGLSRLYAASGDPACRNKVNALLGEWAKCIAPDGYFFYSTRPNAPHYIYDKMVGGLVDAYVYCGNQAATGHLSRITDWAVRHLDRSRRAASGTETECEWYTLSENLYRAYLATGDAKYRDFAAVWEYPEYWDLYARKADLFAVRPSGLRNDRYHAYSHVNTLGGGRAAYLITGEPRYLAILKNAYDYLQANQVFEEDAVDFTFQADRPVQFGLKIRSPLWLAGPMTARLNGQPVPLKVDALHWTTLRREWKSGDRLAIVLPMRLWVSRLAGNKSYPAAIVYGPVVLAVRAADRSFVAKIDLDCLDRDLTPAAGEALTWRLARDPAVLARPFYAYKEGETYYLYLDPAAASDAQESRSAEDGKEEAPVSEGIHPPDAWASGPLVLANRTARAAPAMTNATT